MATVKYSIGSAWTQITEAGSDKDFILQHASSTGILQARFAGVLPTADEAAHNITPDGHPLSRMGVAGNLYVRGVGLGYNTANTITAIISAGA